MQTTKASRLPTSELDDYSTELAQIALDAALSVAPYLKSVARSAPDFTTKRSFHDPVTVHDRHVETLLRDQLGSAAPGCNFLGEESGESSAAPGRETTKDAETEPTKASTLGPRLRWIVDPIDGTANFAAGLIYFGTSIAAEVDGKIVAGVVTVPFVGEAFVADARHAWHMDAQQNWTPLDANGPSTEAEALLATYYPGLWAYENEPGTAARQDKDLLAAYGTVRRPGAGALDLAHVAAGWIGASMGIGFGPWDVAAGIHLVLVAGGSVANLAMGSDLPYGLRPGVVASGRNLDAKTAVAILEEVDRARR